MLDTFDMLPGADGYQDWQFLDGCEMGPLSVKPGEFDIIKEMAEDQIWTDQRSGLKLDHFIPNARDGIRTGLLRVYVYFDKIANLWTAIAYRTNEAELKRFLDEVHPTNPALVKLGKRLEKQRVKLMKRVERRDYLSANPEVGMFG